MNANTNTTPDPAAETVIQRKWGVAVDAGLTGFQALPDVLVRNQHELGLSAGDMVVLLNILMHWWSPESWPHPRTQTIANRMGTSRRTVERHLARLEALGLIKRRRPEPNPSGGPDIRRIELTGLVKKLGPFAQQARELQARRRRKKETAEEY